MELTRFKKIVLLLAGLLSITGFAMSASAASTVLEHKTFTILGTGGTGGVGGGTPTGVMALAENEGDTTPGIYNAWQAGAAGLQGKSSTIVGGGSARAGNLAWKYDVGAVVDSLNSTYGAGNWAIENVKLTFQYTLYAHNNVFGGGAGDFNVYWVENDGWTYWYDNGGLTDVIYTQSESALTDWAGSAKLLAEAYYSWTTPNYVGTTADATNYSVWVTDKTGIRQSTMTIDLGSDSAFLADILTASASGDNWVSLYLMGLSDTLGLCIFTGGTDATGGIRPTLSFDVVKVKKPLPAAVLMLLLDE